MSEQELTAEQLADGNEQIDRFLNDNIGSIGKGPHLDFKSNPDRIYLSWFTDVSGVKKGLLFDRQPPKMMLKTMAFVERKGRSIQDQVEEFCKLNDIKELKRV